MNFLPVPRCQLELIGRIGKRDIANHLGELAVEHHAGQVGTQSVANFALHLVHVGDELLERPVLHDPLGSRLLTHTGDAGQIVAGVAAKSGEIRILRRRQAILCFDLTRGEPGQLGHALLRVQNRDVLGHQLQRVPVPGDDQYAIAERLGLRGEGGDDVVRLESGFGHDRNTHGPEHILGDVHLPSELVRRLAPIRLVVGESFCPKGLARDVERGRDVRRLLVPQQVDQHRCEPVDRVGRLPTGGLEVVHREREERTEGNRVAVDQQQCRLLTAGGCVGRGCGCSAGVDYWAHGYPVYVAGPTSCGRMRWPRPTAARAVRNTNETHRKFETPISCAYRG